MEGRLDECGSLSVGCIAAAFAFYYSILTIIVEQDKFVRCGTAHGAAVCFDLHRCNAAAIKDGFICTDHSRVICIQTTQILDTVIPQAVHHLGFLTTVFLGEG